MTRNLYLGADLTRIVAAAQTGGDVVGAAPLSLNIALGPEQLPTTGRSTAIADEINAARPDLVGLQEVSKFTSPAIPGGVFDYEPILLAQLPTTRGPRGHREHVRRAGRRQRSNSRT